MASRVRKKCLVIAMRAFFDESGLDQTIDRAFVMGADLSETIEDGSACLIRGTQSVLLIPASSIFKSDEANHQSGQFEKFSYTAAQDKKLNLAKIIGSSSLQGICATVPIAISSIGMPKRLKDVMGTRIYDWGFLTAVSASLQYMQSVHPDQKSRFHLDERQ